MSNNDPFAGFDNARPSAARFNVTYNISGSAGFASVELQGGADASQFLDSIGKSGGRYTVNVRRRTVVTPAVTNADGSVTPAVYSTNITNNVESTFVLQEGDQIIVSPSKIAGATLVDASFDSLA